jgi:hypothetical protein
MEELKAHVAKRTDAVIAEAVSTVLAASGEPSAGAWGGICSMPEDEIQRIADRAGLDRAPVDLHPLAFKDRHHEVHVPLEGAETLARAFAAAEPETVLMAIEDSEEELRASGYEPGHRYRHELLRRYKPGWALARHWAGFEREVEMLQKEVERLRGLVAMAATELRSSGEGDKARRLLRALDGR